MDKPEGLSGFGFFEMSLQRSHAASSRSPANNSPHRGDRMPSLPAPNRPLPQLPNPAVVSPRTALRVIGTWAVDAVTWSIGLAGAVLARYEFEAARAPLLGAAA